MLYVGSPPEAPHLSSNFPLRYRLTWLPRFFSPSLAGEARHFAPPSARWSTRRPAVRLVFVGDISAVAGPAPPEIDSELVLILASADLVVGNCESPVVARPGAPLATRLGLRHAMDGPFLDRLLAAMHVEPSRLVLSVANNHIMDQGVRGFEETGEALRKRGIRVIGTAADPATIVGLRGIDIGILAFTEWRNAPAVDFDSRIATAGGLEASAWQPLREMRAHLRCVVPHWDWEFRHFPRPGTRALAAALASAGADIVAGHHAHVLQPVGRVGETAIAYGLGDFLGTGLPRQPWHGRIGALFVADVAADPQDAGKLAAYALVPFFRTRAGGRQRLVSISALRGKIGSKVTARISRVTGSSGLPHDDQRSV